METWQSPGHLVHVLPRLRCVPRSMAWIELAIAYFNSRVVPLENILMVKRKGSPTSQL